LVYLKNEQKVKTQAKGGRPTKRDFKSIGEKEWNNPCSIFNETIFPVISNQKRNSYLKEIADLCDISKNLTFHLARHTFATTVTLRNGVPIETLSEILGHTSTKTTQIYGRILDARILSDMLNLQSKLALFEYQSSI